MIYLKARVPRRAHGCAMGAKELRRDLQRYCYLLTRITDAEGVKFLMELIDEATVRLMELEAAAEEDREA
ncbi:MAG TPA: hypothetical protein VE397_09245 [Stellaceae bacterium]|nr:hypothetical protein [Stellaceae bacterium]